MAFSVHNTRTDFHANIFRTHAHNVPVMLVGIFFVFTTRVADVEMTMTYARAHTTHGSAGHTQDRRREGGGRRRCRSAMMVSFDARVR